MPSHHAERLARARCALEGLAMGDAFGQYLQIPASLLSRIVAGRKLPGPPWYFTDDTNMALSIYFVLSRHAGIDQDRLAHSLADRYDNARGYSMTMRSLLPAIRQGASWRKLAPTLFGRKGSFGSDAATRVAPVGAYFADDLTSAAEHARLSATVTHSHPEAVAGAIAVAVATALAWQQSRANPPPSDKQFLERVLLAVPESKVRDGLQRACRMPTTMSAEEAAAVLGHGSHTTAQDTVPFAIWCAAGNLNDFEEALWKTAGGQGDTNATCAIVGGIVALATGVEGIPDHWRNRREPLPDWPFMPPNH